MKCAAAWRSHQIVFRRSQHLEAPLHAQVLILNVYSMLIAFVLNYNLIIAHKYNLHRIYIKQWVNSSKFWSATGPRSEWYTLKLLPYWGLTNFKKFLYKVILGAMVETEYYEWQYGYGLTFWVIPRNFLFGPSTNLNSELHWSCIDSLLKRIKAK